MKTQKPGVFRLCCLGLALVLTGCSASGERDLLAASAGQAETATTFAMDTLVTQTAYGESAKDAMREVNEALASMEKRLSLFSEESEIAKINQMAGQGGAEVSAETAALLQQAARLSEEQGDGAFAVTIAPLTLAWGITTDSPRVPSQAEIEALLPLVGDDAIQFSGNTVALPQEGMGLDLGGIAKGAACSTAADIYTEHGVDSALLSIGGNVYARGYKPDGSAWRVGFRDPENDAESYIASFSLTDKVIAVSGGYERFFEEDGVKYIHIIDPRTGYPAQSDILSVGVIHPDGAEADFLSTTLFVQGVDAALRYMRQGGQAIVLDSEGNLYVSESLQPEFSLYPEKEGEYTLQFIAAEETR